MITMISLYSQDKEIVTIFETLKLFAPYTYIQYLRPSMRLDGPLCNAIYIFLFYLSREMKKKEE